MFPNYNDFPIRESLNSDTYDDDFDQTCKEIKVFPVTNHFEPLSRTLFDIWKMATGLSHVSPNWVAMKKGDDLDDPIRPGGIGWKLLGKWPIRDCKRLVQVLFPDEKGFQLAMKAVTWIRKINYSVELPSCEVISTVLCTHLLESELRPGASASGITTAILMTLLQTNMTPENLKMSRDYTDALMLVSVEYGKSETIASSTVLSLIAVNGAVAHDPHPDRTRGWVRQILEFGYSLLKDQTKGEEAEAQAHEIDYIAPKLAARMLYYPPTHFIRQLKSDGEVQPYQSPWP